MCIVLYIFLRKMKIIINQRFNIEDSELVTTYYQSNNIAADERDSTL